MPTSKVHHEERSSETSQHWLIRKAGGTSQANHDWVSIFRAPQRRCSDGASQRCENSAHRPPDACYGYSSLRRHLHVVDS